MRPWGQVLACLAWIILAMICLMPERGTHRSQLHEANWHDPLPAQAIFVAPASEDLRVMPASTRASMVRCQVLEFYPRLRPESECPLVPEFLTLGSLPLLI